MKTALYTLSGAIAAERGLADVFGPEDKDGNKPLIRKGVEIKTREAETLEEMTQLVEDGKPDNVKKLAQAQLDIIVQRQIRNAAEDKVTAAILNGETVTLDSDLEGVGAEGDKVDFSGYSEDDRREVVRLRCQAVADSYVYGGRGPSTGAGKVTKERAQKQQKLEAAAASGDLDPETIEKLKALGVI